jgi:eukaryotic-like serine/threonine-protein kinase
VNVDWARLSQLYDEGASLPPEAREAWLTALPEPALRERLQRMLAPSSDTDEQIDRLREAVAAALPVGARLQAGDRLGAWALEGLLGEGGMGQVWRARRADGLYAAQAAVKLLRSDLGSEELRARFARERRLLARLQHPGIAQLLDAGVDATHGAFLVLEYVEGETLTQHVRERQLGVTQRVALLIEIAQAVQAAHAQLVVHRDLKPANVLVSPQGRPKLLDFGIATLLDQEGTEQTQITRLAGARMTPAYAAPEQIAGEPVSTAVDGYALGVMLFELLTGFPPQGAGSLTRTQLEHAVLHQEPARFAELLALPERRDGPGRPPDAVRCRSSMKAPRLA